MSLAMTMALLLALSTAAAGAERHEDAVGDAVGMAPEIVAVTVAETDIPPLVSISVEFASEPPLRTDEETYTDVVMIGLLADPEVDSDGQPTDRVVLAQFAADYIIGTHGMMLPTELDSGASLLGVEDGSHYWQVVDVAVHGPTVTWSVDRQLIGSPRSLGVLVVAGIESEDATELEYDIFPEIDEPFALFELGATAG
jgi:hypothetical protein